MQELEKYYNAIKKVSCQDECKIRSALEEIGLYTKREIFPIPSLQFELTSHCNVICKHCYNNSGMNSNTKDAMTGEKWKQFAEYIVKRGGVFECILSGGEPFLLGEKLFDIMDILHNDGTIFMLLTNGYLLSEKYIERLAKYRYHWLQISIDGVNALCHDSFRQKNGSWERAVSGVKMAAKYGIPVKVAHCVTPYNIENIDEMCEYAYSIGASAITIGELCYSGRAALNTDLLLSEEQKILLKEKVEKNYEKYKKYMKVKTSNSVKEGLERHKKNPKTSAVIRPNGDVRIDGMAPFVVGNILEEDFVEIWEKRLAKAWQNPIVIDYISKFGEDDRNYSFVNYIEQDMYIM